MSENGISSSQANSFDYVPEDISGSPEVEALLGGTKWGDWVGQPVTLTYSFPSGTAYYSTNYGGTEWSNWEAVDSTHIRYIEQALTAWESISNIDFVPVQESSTRAGDIRFAFSDSVSATSWGHAYFPGRGAACGDVWINPEYYDESFAPGTYNYLALLHEIGHALGLKHPHEVEDENATTMARDKDVVDNTVMSYNHGSHEGDEFGWPTAPGVYDDMAVDLLYGYNPTGAAGAWRAGAMTAGRDTFAIASGTNTYNAGGGIDTATVGIQRSAATVRADGSGFRITATGIDSLLVNVERIRFTDGTQVIDPANDTAGQAYRFYRAALGRLPDNAGLVYQTNRLDQGVSLEDVGAGYLTSPEFLTRFPGLDAGGYVGQLYQNVLNRSATADEIAFHVTRLDQGVSWQGVLIGFSESPEYITRLAPQIPDGIWFT